MMKNSKFRLMMMCSILHFVLNMSVFGMIGTHGLSLRAPLQTSETPASDEGDTDKSVAVSWWRDFNCRSFFCGFGLGYKMGECSEYLSTKYGDIDLDDIFGAETEVWAEIMVELSSGQKFCDRFPEITAAQYKALVDNLPLAACDDQSIAIRQASNSDVKGLKNSGTDRKPSEIEVSAELESSGASKSADLKRSRSSTNYPWFAQQIVDRVIKQREAEALALHNSKS